jgi:hypothetical protein
MQKISLKVLIPFYILVIIHACTVSNKSVTNTEKKVSDCSVFMTAMEKEVWFSCPISKGPIETITHLENMPTFVRNKEHDTYSVYGSVIFNAKNAKNAKFTQDSLIDDKSLGVKQKIIYPTRSF